MKTKKRMLISGTNGVLGGELLELLTVELDADWELVGLFSSERSRDACLSRTPHHVAARLRPLVWNLTEPAESTGAGEQLGKADLTIGVHRLEALG